MESEKTVFRKVKNMRHLTHFVVTAMLLAGAMMMGTGCQTQIKDFSNETQKQKDKRMAWWRQARFGMFIHWGLYAIPAGEWNGNNKHAEWIRHTAQIPLGEYEKFAPQFNPVNFDADEWVRMAKDAGMKYMVITSKHHDGFCLWDSDQTDFDIMGSTPFKRDILRELSDACKKQGIKMCFYHSIMDWHHPDYLPRRKWENRSAEGADYQRYITHMKAQLKELVENYDPAVLWFDGEWEDTWTHEEGLKLYDYVRSLKPDIIINNRVDKGRSGMKGMNKEGTFAGDFGTPEQEVPETGFPGVDWESCITMNRFWGWNKNDKKFKSTKYLIEQLVDIASKGGNYLLNIGPKPDGTFPAESIERLEQIGDWMDVNGESIYGTTASPFERLSWGRCTKKIQNNGATLYLHVFDWPKDGKLLVPGLRNKIKKAAFLADAQKLKTTADEQGVIVHLPAQPLDEIDTVVVLKVSGALHIEKVLPTQNSDGVVTLSAEEADIHGGPKLEKKGGKRNIGYWFDPGSLVEWPLIIRDEGKFTVKAEIASGAPNSSFEIIIGSQPIKVTVESTGGYDKFRVMTLGQTERLETGEHKLQVKPRKDKWQPINIRSIKLEPIK